MTDNRFYSLFPYPGSKGRRASWIIEQLPAHETYIEPFGGSGSVLYHKPPSALEIYNDINDDLVQFFKITRDRPDELAEWLARVPYSRSVYNEWATQYFQGERPGDPIERAGRFYTLRFMSFAGRIDAKSGFKTRNIAEKSPARTFDRARERIRAIAERFSEVIIECRDWREVATNYDGEHVLMYFDPPYVNTEHWYRTSGFDHAAFADALTELEADWLVSYTDLPEPLECDEFHIITSEHYHQMAQGHGSGGKDVTERLVCNFDPSHRPRFVDGQYTQQKLGGESV